VVEPHGGEGVGSARGREPGAWLVVGAGRCGLQLARSMAAAGVPLSAVVDADPGARARARRCLPGVAVLAPGERLPSAWGGLLAVPDSAIAACAAGLAARVGRELRLAAHTSGVLPAAVLEPLRAPGRSLAALHPLMAFGRGDGPLVPLAGVAAAVEGDPRGVRHVRALARRLGLAPVSLPARHKPLYHALAALAANLAPALVAAAARELAGLGPRPGWERRALAPLVLQAVRNVLETGDLSRLTGPLTRGDAATVRTHLEALPDCLAEAYASAARVAVEGLRRDGRITPETASALDGALTNPVRCGSVLLVRLGEEG